MSPIERDEPLFAAIKRNDSEAVQLALKHGANVNAAKTGFTASSEIPVIFMYAKKKTPTHPPCMKLASWAKKKLFAYYWMLVRTLCGSSAMRA